MKLGVQFSVPSKIDIEDIFEYSVQEFGLKVPINYTDSIDETDNRLSQNPFLGLDRSEIKSGLYSFVCREHITFYRIFKTHLHIKRVLHANRDYIKFLK